MAEDRKAVTYESQDHLFFILAPVKTRTFKNETNALQIAEKAIETLSPVDNVYNIAPSIYGERLDDRSSPNNMVRNTENMSSTSQVVFNLTQRKVLLYLIPGKVKYLGVKSELPDGYTPKISIEVFKYTDLDSDNEFDVIKKSPKK